MMSQPNSSPHCLRPQLLALLLLSAFAALYGCGGSQDFGGFSRGLGGDVGSGYNNSLGSRYRSDNGKTGGGGERGTYPMIETSFQLANVPGDPFDFEKVNVQVMLRKPDGGTAEVPAFFDGGTTWRMRYTPTAPGQYSITEVKLNRETAHEEKMEKKEWTVAGDPQPGFVRIDKGDHSRFVFDSGARYFPLGHNQAWHSDKLPDIPDLFAKMHAAGENWSRVWMNHWDGKNLDWTVGGKPGKPGEINLEVAKRWDAIIAAASKNDIYFQMTLQHHGPYSTTTDSNWNDNPYNAKNGGFLQNPDDFFTNPQARALTRRKLYYTLARWGYSPNIMAFELFNEVENTDAAHNKRWDDVAMWHKEMTLFLRQFDLNRHLVTTSAVPGVPLDNPVWETVDYIQQHAYPNDLITTLGSPYPTTGKKLDKPIFHGEFGPQNLQDTEGIGLHLGLWASLMRGAGGAAQYWSWDAIEQHDLYSHFKAASGFLAASDLANHGDLTSTTLPVETAQTGTLRFGPGGGWETATQMEFVVGTSGPPAGMGKLPAFLQGTTKRSMMPKPLTFQVVYPKPGTFTVTVAQVAKSGGSVKVSVEGKSDEHTYPAADKDYRPKAGEETVKVEVPAGAHTVTVENNGSDWVVVKEFALSGYAPALVANARVGKDYAVAWVYHRANVDAPADKEKSLEATTGKISLTGLKAGKYRATWWDTREGKSLDAADLTIGKEKETTLLTTPPITRDVALYVVKAGTSPAEHAKGKKSGKGKVTAAQNPYAKPDTTSPVPTTNATAPPPPKDK